MAKFADGNDPRMVQLTGNLRFRKEPSAIEFGLRALRAPPLNGDVAIQMGVSRNPNFSDPARCMKNLKTIPLGAKWSRLQVQPIEDHRCRP